MVDKLIIYIFISIVGVCFFLEYIIYVRLFFSFFSSSRRNKKLTLIIATFNRQEISLESPPLISRRADHRAERIRYDIKFAYKIVARHTTTAKRGASINNVSWQTTLLSARNITHRTHHNDVLTLHSAHFAALHEACYRRNSRPIRDVRSPLSAREPRNIAYRPIPARAKTAGCEWDEICDSHWTHVHIETVSHRRRHEYDTSPRCDVRYSHRL